MGVTCRFFHPMVIFPHPGGGQAPALHFPLTTPGLRLSPEYLC